jgi:stage II sporulation protein D
MRRGLITAVLGLVVAAAGLSLVPSAAAAATWEAAGAGWGHGVGMSAYGAYGYGKHGFSHAQILHHYYTGTKIEATTKGSRVRVLLRVSTGDVTFTRASAACGRKLSPGRSYRARRSGRSVRLLSAGGAVLARCGKRLHASGGGKIKVAGLGSYRGALEVVAASGVLNVVNKLDVNDYVRGVLPAEVPPSWPAPTLRAMAIAMRSVALSTSVHGDGFDLYSDTRTQVYRGAGSETATTDKAVAATRDQVVTYAGSIAQTTYFSSSGGRTESNFLGAPKVPYLKSVDDPYDYYSPLHRWTARFTQAQMDARLGPYLKGSLRGIKVTQRGDSPRIVTARLTGSGGTTTIRGDRLAGALGLYSRWAYFRKQTGGG